MWHTALGIASLVFICLSTYLVYAFGMMILRGEWHLFVITLLLWAVSLASVIIIGLIEG